MPRSRLASWTEVLRNLRFVGNDVSNNKLRFTRKQDVDLKFILIQDMAAAVGKPNSQTT